MNEKKNRLAAAITLNVVLLIVILAVVIICQVAALVNKSAERDRLQREIDRYEQAIENDTDQLEYLKSEQYKIDLLINYGYKPKN